MESRTPTLTSLTCVDKVSWNIPLYTMCIHLMVYVLGNNITYTTNSCGTSKSEIRRRGLQKLSTWQLKKCLHLHMV